MKCDGGRYWENLEPETINSILDELEEWERYLKAEKIDLSSLEDNSPEAPRRPDIREPTP